MRKKNKSWEKTLQLRRKVFERRLYFLKRQCIVIDIKQSKEDV